MISRVRAFASIIKQPKHPQTRSLQHHRFRSIFQKNILSISSTSFIRKRPLPFRFPDPMANGHLTKIFHQQQKHDRKEHSWRSRFFSGFPTLILLAAPFCVSFREAAYSKVDSPSVLVSPRKGLAWVRECLEKHPEIEYLADKDVQKTEDGKEIKEGTYSEKLYNGEHFVEFERTVMSLHCLRLIVDGSVEAYNTFVKDQKGEKLSTESFDEMHRLAKKMIEDNPFGLSQKEMLDLMTAELVLGNMGKSKKARELFAPYGVDHEDHDKWYQQMIEVLEKNPRLSPTYNKLSPKARELLKEEYYCHLGHASHLEGGAHSMFGSIVRSKILQKNPDKFLLHLICHLADVAAAAGQVNPQSSLVMTQQTYFVLNAVKKALLSVRGKDHLSEQDQEILIYNKLLSIRAENLGLNPTSREGKVLTIMGSMMRLFGQENGKLLQYAFSQLTAAKREALLEAIEQRDSFLETPTYLPALLSNAYANPLLGDSPKRRMFSVFFLISEILPRVFSEYDQSRTLNFNALAGIAKSNHPFSLLKQMSIEEDGMIRVQH